MKTPIASLSLDLDNKWTYLKVRGDPSWEKLPSYLDLVTPRILKLFDDLDVRATVFVVGQDAVLETNREAISAIAAAGHEIANHSFHHEPWLHRYSERELEDEVIRAEEAIAQLTGQHPRGFRGPGFSRSDALVHILARRGYLYDASTLPTFLGPVARAYYFLRSNLDDKQRKQRQGLFGQLRDGFLPLDAYWCELSAGGLVEIPVTTMPITRLPIHFSYLAYLSQFSQRLASHYWQTALSLCSLTGVAPSLLLHPLDLMGEDDDAAMRFFPGMNVPLAKKQDLVMNVLTQFTKSYNVQPLIEHARHVRACLGMVAEPLACGDRELREVPEFAGSIPATRHS